MSINRRDVLKKGAALGAVALTAGALGIVNAPTAQAATANWDNLINWRTQHGWQIFGWDRGVPGYFMNYYWIYAEWGKSSSYPNYENDSALYWNTEYQQWDTLSPWSSWNQRNIGISSVVMLQRFLNALVEKGALGGSLIAADGSFGTITHNKVAYYQSGRGLVVDGVVGRNTWDSLQAQLGGLGL